MKRAAILIGVDETGDLPKLNDAAKGAWRMAAWARGQKMDPVTVITDEAGPVEIGQVFKAVAAIEKKGTCEQLIVYFAGHGVNIGGHERWLLSDAPDDGNAAVNLSGSAERAHNGVIPHVVFISDACRTAAQTMAGQSVSGSLLFSPTYGRPEQAVDKFWACLLGDPAAEIRDKNVTAAEYKALYTGALLDALAADNPQVAEIDGAGAVVRPRPLKHFLREAMARRLKELNLQTKLIQVPDARITSENDAWIARLEDAPPLVAAAQLAGRAKGEASRGADAETSAHPELISRSLLSSVTEGAGLGMGPGLDNVEARSAIAAVDLALRPFGPAHFETQCGFKVRGARVVEAFSARGNATLLGHALVRMDSVERPGASVLLVFENGSGAVLPAIPGFIAALTVEDGRLNDVAYEPSENHDRWRAFRQRATEMRTLRAIAAVSTKSGVFRLDGDEALDLARRMQYAKGVDPTLAVYAAYACLDLRRRDLIRGMSHYMQADFGAPLFDVAMLAGELDAHAVTADQNCTLVLSPIVPGMGARAGAPHQTAAGARERAENTDIGRLDDVRR